MTLGIKFSLHSGHNDLIGHCLIIHSNCAVHDGQDPQFALMSFLLAKANKCVCTAKNKVCLKNVHKVPRISNMNMKWDTKRITVLFKLMGLVTSTKCKADMCGDPLDVLSDCVDYAQVILWTFVVSSVSEDLLLGAWPDSWKAPQAMRAFSRL